MQILYIKTDADLARAEALFTRASSAGEVEATLAAKVDAARGIVADVLARGDAAVAEYTQRFDGVSLDPDRFEVTRDQIEAAYRSIDAELRGALERAHDNIRRFHLKNLRESWEETSPDGTILGQRITPIDSVGVYIPGGQAFYPSSALMNIVPARVAGVREIVMVCPPSYQSDVHPVALAAARIAGVSRVFRIGGAQAVAALAYGTATVPQVLKITGPGNAYVTSAKRLVRGVCEIDTEAGPSEVTVLADESATPALVAAELVAQAEHDEDTRSVLITTSAKLVEAIQKVIEQELTHLSRAEVIRKSLARRGAAIVARTMDEAVALTNLNAPEHLAIYTRAPRETLKGITNAGCIALGEHTTVVYGDYIAGPNHTLPTERRARFASPLSAEDFRKVSSVIEFSKERGAAVADDVMRLATTEGLTAHARAVEIRKT